VSKRRFIIFSITTFGLLVTGCGDLLTGPMVSPDNHIEIGENGIYVNDNGETLLHRVVVAQPSWVCLQADVIGAPGGILGCSAVPQGENQDITVTIDPTDLTWRLHAALYTDAGNPGANEIPDPDVPVLTALGSPVTSEAVLLADPSWITVSNQALVDGDKVIVERAYAPVPSLLVIHDLRDEAVLGYKALQVGENLSVVIKLEVRGQVKDVFAEMHWDINFDGGLNLSDPAAKLSSGEFYMAHFIIQ
jgi:hypothetical protein